MSHLSSDKIATDAQNSRISDIIQSNSYTLTIQHPKIYNLWRIGDKLWLTAEKT